MARKPKTEDAANPRQDVQPDAVDQDLMAVVEATDPLAKRDAPPEPVADTTAEQAEPAEPAAPRPAEPVQKASSGAGAFLGMVLGGIVAFAGGFGVARFMPDLMPALGAGADSATQDAVAAQQAELDALKDQVAALSQAAPDTAVTDGLSDRLAAVETALQSASPETAASPDMAAIEDRLAALESRPAAQGGSAPDSAALDALRAEVDALKAGGGLSGNAQALAQEAEARLAEARDAAAALKAETEAAAAATRRQVALTRLFAALESGAPYSAALADLGGDLPPVLAESAEAGLPTLATLQDTFPDAARRGLEAAINADMGANWSDRVANFLRAQTGARSLTPREGNDPDAILSRAEAALTRGDVKASLADIATLPAPAQDAMADWTAAATRRVQAAEAVAALSRE